MIISIALMGLFWFGGFISGRAAQQADEKPAHHREYRREDNGRAYTVKERRNDGKIR